MSATIAARGTLGPDEVVKYLNTQLESRICVLDGGLRKRIEVEGLGEAEYRGERFKLFQAKDASGKAIELAGNDALLALTQPDLILKAHKEYFLAGSDVCRTCTLHSTRDGQARYKMQQMVYELNKSATQIAKRAAAEVTRLQPERPRLVAGVLGPVAGEWGAMVRAYEEAARGLIDGGADLLLVDQVSCPVAAKAAASAAEACAQKLNRRPLPMIMCASLTDVGTLPSGSSPTSFALALRHARPLALGAAASPQHAAELAGATDGWSLTVFSGATLSSDVPMLASRGLLNLVGGDVTTSASDITTLCSALVGAVPRGLPRVAASVFIGEAALQLTGLAKQAGDGRAHLQVIGQRCSSIGCARFRALMNTYRATRSESSFQAAVDLAAKQADEGADIIDINLDAVLEDGTLASGAGLMAKFVSACATHTKVRQLPLMITSADLEVVLEGLQSAPNRCIVNGICLLAGEEEFLRAARECRRHGAAMVVFAISEGGLSESFEERVAACQRSYRLLRSRLDCPAEDIIFDCILSALGGSSLAPSEFISAVAEVRRTCPGTSCIAGLGNLSLPLRGLSSLRDALHSVFLYHAVPRGLSLVLAEPGCLPLYGDIDEEMRTLCEEVLLNRSAHGDHVKRLLAYANVHGDSVVCLALGGDYPPAPAAKAMLRAATTDSKRVVGDLAGYRCSTPLEQKQYLVSLHPHAARAAGPGVSVLPWSGCQLVGQRCNPQGSIGFRVLVEAHRAARDSDKWQAAAELSAKQVANGADVLDFNVDLCSPNSKALMGKLVRLCAEDPRLANVPVMISSAKWSVIEEGLRHAKGKSIANAISLASGEQEFLRMATRCRQHGAAVVVLPTDEHLKLPSCEDRLRICQRSFELLRDQLDFPAEEVIFDIGLLPLRNVEDSSQIRGCMDMIADLRRTCPSTSVIAGVSNLSLPFRGADSLRDALHSVFLYYAIPRGLNLAIVQVGHLPRYHEIEAPVLQVCEDVVLGNKPPARLFEFARSLGVTFLPEEEEVVAHEMWEDERMASDEVARPIEPQQFGCVARRFQPRMALTDLVQATGTHDGSIFSLFGSKAHAALRFHSYTQGNCLNRAVHFSSISVWMGQGGSGPAVGASAILDAVAMWQRQQQLGTMASTVLWGPVGQIGLRLAVYGARDALAQFDLGQKLIGPEDVQFLERQLMTGNGLPEYIGLAYLDETWQDTLSGASSSGGLERRTFADL